MTFQADTVHLQSDASSKAGSRIGRVLLLDPADAAWTLRGSTQTLVSGTKSRLMGETETSARFDWVFHLTQAAQDSLDSLKIRSDESWS